VKAARIHEYGPPSVIRREDVPRPAPGPGEVLVDVAATSFNPADAALRAGAFAGTVPLAFPHTLCLDVAGTVGEVGEGVDGRTVGDPVVCFLPLDRDGAAADHVLAPTELLTAAPAAIPLADAAALPCAGLTAWQALFEHGRLAAGHRVLVIGAGGGVGSIAVQLAKDAGATVLGTAGPRSAPAVRDLGADEVLDHTARPLTEAVTETVDVLLNLAPLTPEQLAGLTSLLRPGGTLVSATTPVEDEPAPGIRGVRMEMRNDPAQLAGLVRRVDDGRLRVVVAESQPLSRLAQVHGRYEAGRTRGKITILPGG
jgi:NADPH:quinone reductase-like Zn-dependent oxidoreductase